MLKSVVRCTRPDVIGRAKSLDSAESLELTSGEKNGYYLRQEERNKRCITCQYTEPSWNERVLRVGHWSEDVLDAKNGLYVL